MTIGGGGSGGGGEEISEEISDGSFEESNCQCIVVLHISPLVAAQPLNLIKQINYACMYVCMIRKWLTA